MLTWTEIETRAVALQKTWRNATGNEKQDDLKFIADFLHVFGVDWHIGLPQHTVITPDGRYNYIDYLLPGQILIEMKSKNESLDAAFTQAMGYYKALKPEEQPRLMLLSDFNTIRVYNFDKKHAYKPFKVSELRKNVRVFRLLAGYGPESEAPTEIELNTDASYKMARLHDALKANNYTGHPLEVLLVRLLFCLFADDTGIFERGAFRKYIEASQPDGSDIASRLMLLFSILDTPTEQRMTNLSPDLLRFRYIDGSLFREPLPPATFDAKMRRILLDCCEFDWTQISPAIFGAMFQGIMNPQERRELGAHYTSEENILKVIRPLFLDALEAEFERSTSTEAELQTFHDKLASLTFLDPACGSGNFLVIAYDRLRQLEFKVLKLLQSNLQRDFYTDHTKVSLNQFYGIELEDFPCEIAKVSMLLTKHLNDQQISEYFGTNFIDFPIRDNANIVHGNALRLNWNDVIPAHQLDYIMGNPPFIGAMLLNADQTDEMKTIMGHIRGFGELDYVTAWYQKAVTYIGFFPVKCAFVSTNSICQGQSVITFWKHLITYEKVRIDFAYQSFVWNNEAKGQAAVHCVIIGFSTFAPAPEQRFLFQSNGVVIQAKNINPYLIDAENIFIESRSTPISDVSPMRFGSMPRDGGFLIMNETEKNKLITSYPPLSKWIRPYIGSQEFIGGYQRYCLWLVGAAPSDIRPYSEVMNRIENVRQFRLNSKAEATRRFADTPTLFCQVAQPESGNYILVPRVSSERREYVPIGFLDSNTIASDSVFLIPGASIYEFGILTSSTHMAWMRTVAGRLEMRYRYSKDIVYNNFPWPAKTPESTAQIQKTAQAILDARANYPDRSYADLYDPLFMPPDLRKAHQANDRAVWQAYGKAWPLGDEPATVSHLMSLYKDSKVKDKE